VFSASDYTLEPNGCWRWNGNLRADGYGKTGRSGKTRQAHRYVYEQLRGPIPQEYQLDHTCRNRACVNPDHLEIVTGAVNTQRGLTSKLTESMVHEMRSRVADLGNSWRVAKAYAPILGLHPMTIHFAIRRRTWRNVA
jgi:hypothetical protein